MHSQGNILSILAFFIWIPASLWIARRYPSARTASLLLLIPALFLPEVITFKLPGLPGFAKREIAIFWLLIGAALFHRHRLRAVRLNRWLKITMVTFLAGSVVTVFLNMDSLSYGSVHRPGHVPYDAVHFLMESALNFILPFVLAAAMFNGPKDLRVLLRMLVGAALAYSVLQLVELRLSPQLHNWVYGFHQHGFSQTVRGGGFRPMVFMEHGLAVAMFTVLGVLSAAALYKVRIPILRVSASWATACLWLVLLLSKSVAAFLYTLVAVPLILFLSPKTQFRVATFLAVMALLYPAVRGAGIVPVDDIKEWVGAEFNEDRVSSIMTRFDNEEDLLDRAHERFSFGWGGYCRACIYDPWDAKLLTTFDGDWIFTVGRVGIVGFLSKYLLMFLPILMAARHRKRVPRQSDRRLLSALALMVGFSMFDLLPNGNFNYLVYALAGALYGCCRGTVAQASMRARANQQQAKARRSARPALSSTSPGPATSGRLVHVASSG